VNLENVRERVRRIRELAQDPSTHWEAENEERELETAFVVWCAGDARMPPNVSAIALAIFECHTLDFPRNYATEEE